MNVLDKLQQVWQSQCNQPLDVKPEQFARMPGDLLLMTARFERWAYFVIDMLIILLLLIPGTWMLTRIREIHKDWPWLIYVSCIAWVIGFMLYHRWRRRRHAPHYDAALVAHVEWAIKDIEYRMWQDRYMLWWYIVPLALGCMIPTAITFGREFLRTHDWEVLFTLLLGIGFFAAFFAAVHWFISRVQRMHTVVEVQRRELEALWALRETLLNPDGPHGSSVL
jgi:hypothetical protein